MNKLTFLLILLSLTILTVNSQTVNLTKNPYANVNWSSYNQYKSSYHTHTTNSDGSQTPSTVINEYSSKGYSILSITDHNVTTWPWPHNPGMLAIRGNEYSSSHHMNAFINFTNTSSNLENGIPHVQSKGGISQINHPGRYNSPSNWSWYIPWFRDYSSCVALEVYNQGDRYSSDRQLWDNINENLFPQTGKLVWGTSNDDKHSTSHLYGNFNFMLMPDLTQASWVECMTNGAFYFCREPGESGNANVPRINNIVVDNVAKTITITATGYNKIEWIGPGTSVVATGNVFDYSAYTDKPFIRAVLDGSNGDSYTQPFGFVTTLADPPVADFTAGQTAIDIGQSVSFTDQSTNNPTSWSWSFNGGTPTSSSLQNPTITYNTPGNYSVTLTAANAGGSDGETKTNYITVNALPSYTLITNTTGSGSISLNPAGGTYTEGTNVNLTANPNTGWVFSHWTGDLTGYANPANVTMNANKSVTAVFTAVPTYNLTTSVTGNGSIALNPAGGTYSEGTIVTATANPAAGYQFDNWSGDLTGSTNPASITMNADKTITANFSLLPPSADVQILGSWEEGNTHNVEAGVSRALVFTVHAEDDNADMNTSVSYGGQTMTKVVESNEGSGYRAYTAIFILDEAGISAASNATFSVNWAQAPSRTPSYASVFLGGVNQSDVTGAIASNGASSAATVSTSTLSTDDGDMVIVSGTCGNTGTYTVNNGFTEGIEVVVSSGDGVAGYKLASGANETASITHSNANRQAIVAMVINAGSSAPAEPPVANFTASQTIINQGQSIIFSDASTNNPTSWSWTFEGGSPAGSTAQNPTVTYNTPGVYNVSLTAANSAGSDVETKTSYITVNEATGPVQISYDDFEGGWGNWTDGGGDCSRYTGGTYAHQGNVALDIQDNSGVASSFYLTNPMDLSGYSEITVDFWYYPVSMDNSNEDFWLQYYDGSGWVTVDSWARDIDFSNNNFYHETVTISSATYTFTANSSLRFMCDASGNQDDVFIDEITISGVPGIPLKSVEEISNEISEEIKSFDFEIYPNPTSNNQVTIKLNTNDVNHSVKIFSINGAVVYGDVITEKVSEIYLDNIEAGMYLIQVGSSSDVKMKRLIVK